MESNEQREPIETSEDREPGTPQDEMLGGDDQAESTSEEGADSPAEAGREGA
jgi:hypothetical protein